MIFIQQVLISDFYVGVLLQLSAILLFKGYEDRDKRYSRQLSNAGQLFNNFQLVNQFPKMVQSYQIGPNIESKVQLFTIGTLTQPSWLEAQPYFQFIHRPTQCRNRKFFTQLKSIKWLQLPELFYLSLIFLNC